MTENNMSQNQTTRKNSSKFFCNKDCEFFPCHETDDPDNFNCLFCYCPLYALGKQCGGNCKLLGGICKDCSDCMIPHKPENYDWIIGKYDEIMELAAKNFPENCDKENTENKKNL